MPIVKLILILLLSVHTLAFNDGPISEEVMAKAERKYSGLIVSRYLAYNKMLKEAEHVSERNKLQIVNSFFNAVPYQDDMQNWKQEDYWATPLEFLARNKGDGEDYVIAKYFALKTLKIDTKKLYFTYVNSAKLKRPHMVLSYFESPGTDPFVLDNFNEGILSAKDRDDLTPIYNFNADSVKSLKNQQSTHKKWKKLIKRVQRNKL